MWGRHLRNEQGVSCGRDTYGMNGGIMLERHLRNEQGVSCGRDTLRNEWGYHVGETLKE